MFTLVIILLVLMTVSITGVWILLGENWCWSPLGLNPLGLKSDQHQFSPNNISRSSRVNVTRITKLMTKGRML